MKIYLCGPIQNRTTEDCTVWRNWATQMWPGETLDPLRRDYRGREHENIPQLVNEDLLDIDNSDGLLVYYDKPSVGSSMEVFYAHHVLKKPVVVWNNSDHVLSPWLLHHADHVTKRKYDALLTLHHLIVKNRHAR